MKKAGVTQIVARSVFERDYDGCVVWITHPGRVRQVQQIHHRRPRSMGGSQDGDTNMPANLLSICAECHSWVELNRNAAISKGWLVQQGKIPTEVPVLWREVWVMLTNAGTLRMLGKPG